MLLQRDVNPELNTVTGYGDDYLEINQVRHVGACCFAPEGPVRDLELRTFEGLNAASLQALLGLELAASDPLDFLDDEPAEPVRPANAPEVVLIGTGAHQAFLAPEVTQPLLALGIGVETMTTHAAARTYNILMSEERRVLALLLPGDSLS